MVESSPKGVENAVGKGEIARYEQFLLFPQGFKRHVLQTLKNKALVGEGFITIVCNDMQLNKQNEQFSNLETSASRILEREGDNENSTWHTVK